MCRDYNPHNTECSFSLTKLYVGFGAFELAFAELENLLTVERRNREMLNHFKEWDCDIPAVAVTLFGHLLTRDPSSPGLAKYLLMLVRLLCTVYITFTSYQFLVTFPWFLTPEISCQSSNMS